MKSPEWTAGRYREYVLLSLVMSAVLLSCASADAQTFTKLAAPITNDNSAGCGWIDYNSDGRVDAYLTGFNKSPVLYSNNGDGTFLVMTQSQLIPSGSNYSGVCWGDYDNDGLTDLFVSNMGGGVILLKNKGDGNFENVDDVHLPTMSGSFLSANWVDYDNDGNLDLFVTASGTSFQSSSSTRNLLYRNNGDGTFTLVTDNALASHQANSNCAAFGDYDNDGKMDVFLTEWGRDNLLFKNNGDGTFTEISGTEINSNRSISITASWGDYDNDGFLDLFVGNGSTSSSVKQKSCLFHNNGDGTFAKITGGDVADYSGCVWASGWCDVNNDGYLDLFAGTIYEKEPLLFINDREGGLTLTHEFGIDSSAGGTGITGISFGDYDNDGYQDILVADANGSGRTVFYHNNGGSNHWLTVTCNGIASNRSAIGARVKIKATIGGKSFWQIREITGVQGFRGSDDLRVHFGLGDTTLVDSLVVQWPSGIRTVRTGINADQFLSLTEDVPDNFIKASFSADNQAGFSPLTVQFKDLSRFNPQTPVTSWSWDLNGDGIEESREKNPAFVYDKYEGNEYDVRLIVSNGSTADTVVNKGFVHLIPSSEQNIAPRGVATASSARNESFSARRLVDGSLSSQWWSSASDTQWVVVRYDTVQTVGRIILRWGISYGTHYRISCSLDSGAWVQAAQTDDGNGNSDTLTFGPLKVKYIRLDATESSTHSGYRMLEFEIYKPVVNSTHENGAAPSEFELLQNYPNPFNPTTAIGYSVPSSTGRDLVSSGIRDGQLSAVSRVSLKVFDVLGREVAVLVNEFEKPGRYEIRFDGARLASGVYFYRLQAGGSTQMKKMVLLK